MNSLLVSEIAYTNRIEGVETARGEISTSIRENEENSQRPFHKRLQSTIRMYQETQSDHLIKIEQLRPSSHHTPRAHNRHWIIRRGCAVLLAPAVEGEGCERGLGAVEQQGIAGGRLVFQLRTLSEVV